MMDTAEGKILNALETLLAEWPELTGRKIITDRIPDDALYPAVDLPAIVIYAEAWSFGASYEQGQTRHDMLINFECIETTAHVGVVSRENQACIAHIIAALHSDRTLGGRLEDMQERDVAPPMDNGRSVGGASLQIGVQFHTPRGDHFTIVGQGGDVF